MAEDTMLQNAIQALRKDDREQARDLLTRLLKTDQNNPTYWVWLSAAVETQKERIYCLQTALKLDPQNAAAKRGLILLGALPPDDSIPPFPLNHPRLWEEKLSIQTEPKAKILSWENPIVRILTILGAGILMFGILYQVYLVPRGYAPDIFRNISLRLTNPLTRARSTTPLYRGSTSTFSAQTPLWMLLHATYTPTPFYVSTVHPAISRGSFEAGLRYMGKENYSDAIILFQQALDDEPQAADIYYYIGECYFQFGEYRTSRDFYQQAIDADPNFAAGYLGRAMARQKLNPNFDIASDLNQAIKLDPLYVAAYIERGIYKTEQGKYEAALADLQTARELNPNSSLTYYYLAETQLTMGHPVDALTSAKKSNELDITYVPTYWALAQAYIANEQLEQAIGPLQTYTLYEANNADAFYALGMAYNQIGAYESAIAMLDRAIGLNQHYVEAYYQRGAAYYSLDNIDKAKADFTKTVAYKTLHYDANFKLALIFDLQGHPGDAYLQLEKGALPVADTDAKKAQVYYWEAIFLEKISNFETANQQWRRLLSLPESAMDPEWRTEALERLGITATPTLHPTQTPTPTR